MHAELPQIHTPTPILAVRALDFRLHNHEFDSRLPWLVLGWVTVIGWANHLSISQPLRPTQPPTLSGTGNQYQTTFAGAPWLGSKCRYGSFHLRINEWAADKTV